MNIRRWVAFVLAAAGMIAVSGCQYTGANSLSLPGDVGTGADSYKVTIELADAQNIVPNTPVLVDDINVGTITNVGLNDWTPSITISLKDSVKLPQNVEAKIGQTSLLGSKHIDLIRPANGEEQGQLKSGDLIPASRAGSYPSTEAVLSSASLLLNGGGLQQAHTIVAELNRALGNRTDNYRDFLTQLDTFSGGLDKQKSDIIAAITGFDRLSTGLASQTPIIDRALETLPQGLATLNDQEKPLVTALRNLGEWGDAMRPLSQDGSTQLRGLFDELTPTLKRTADAGTDTVKALNLIPVVIFPLDRIGRSFRGDYVNFKITLDLTLASLDKNFLGGTPFEGSLAGVEDLLRSGGGSPGTQATNPLELPMFGPQAGSAQPAPAFPPSSQLPLSRGVLPPGPGATHVVPKIGG
jgi:phospholipid/cholesterol/gamma-HCH transport system substrate-binding protein